MNYLQKNIDKIKKARYTVILVSLLLKYLIEKHKVQETDIISIKKQLTFKNPSKQDTYVPTDQEIQQTLSQLSEEVKVVYLMYLVSGIRKIEGSYLLANINKLKTQEMEGFVKITMNYLRHNKNSFFCYLPIEIYSKLAKDHKLSLVRSLELEIKHKNLIPIKYCRKWFYTKCIELGVPESIADFYEGRVSNSVGSNNYLSKQMLADRYYKEKLVNELNNLEFMFS
jgi:intergrase/recombinase